MDKSRLNMSRNRLRKIKHEFYDDYSLTLYRITSIKGKILNFNFKSQKNNPKPLTEIEKEKAYNNIINSNASSINLFPFNDNSPLVSIIILNRNGLKHLKRLFKDFKKNLQYPAYEIIVVDNASTDGSIGFLEEISDKLPLKVIKNNENVSFAKSNNYAASIANGEYILLLNNDVEPLYGWLNEMMQTALKSDNTGAVGAKLIYPDSSKSVYNKNNSFKIQHMGIAFKKEEGLLKPYNLGNIDPFEDKGNLEEERVAVTAAAMLIKKDTYWKVNGFDERYNYGYEDVDLCLKLLKKGYKNIYCPKAALFHYEFGTQERGKSRKIMKWRFYNRKLFNNEWGGWLQRRILIDKIENNKLFSEEPLKIAFTVTESGDNASAGDYFTALEFGESLKKSGFEVIFLSRKGSKNWYEIDEDVDILISLLDIYDHKKIKCSNDSLIKIAWARNWFDRWTSNPIFSEYDIILAPSETACRYIKEKTRMKAILFPLAANTDRFNEDVQHNQKYSCDYCFTGSYWDDPREIIDMLDPESLPYKFNLYGKNWEKIDKFKKYNQGFVNYLELPQVYASTKIVINDANRVTRPYGSTNSRVYDAIANGSLVLTNGDKDAKETFNGKLPFFRSKDELNSLIEFYLENEDARISKINELRDYVLNNHTYDMRVLKLMEIIKNHIIKTRIAIKIAAPKWETVHEWGDYHLALGLKKELERENCDVLLQILPEWENREDAKYNVVLVLRGLSQYKPKNQHFNIMWNISHPDKVTVGEYDQYNYVLIASKYWAEKIGKMVDVPVESMLQCTDPELFYPDYDKKYEHELLFVGNSRKVLRKIIKDLLPIDRDLSVYGTNWKGLIDKKYIKGNHIPNQELRKAYSSCKILLNDHWDDMRDKGFISNRLFDGLAAGAFIISDNVNGAEEVFGNALVTYDHGEDLHLLIENYLTKNNGIINENHRNDIVNNHTFKRRVEHILDIIDSNL